VAQPLVLAIEPDLRQAAIVKRIVREKVQADVAVVDSRDAALEAMRTTVPDVLLLSALMSPRDEDELIAHLRTLEHADHLQTHTIPQLASVLGPAESRGPRGLLSAFRRKKEADAAPAGCDPDLFADEIRVFLQRAADKKRERSNADPAAVPADTAWRTAPSKTAAPVTGADAVAETGVSSSSSWSSPFEWKPSASFSASPSANPSSLIPDPESLIKTTSAPESTIAPAPVPTPDLMAHLRPPAAVVTAEELVSHVREPLVATTPIDVPIQIAEPIHVVEPIRVAEPIHVAEPIPVPAQIQESGIAVSRIRDARSAMRDSGLGIRDKRSGIKDKGLGALATWARSERRGKGAAQGSDDLRGLLTGLAVPSAVVAVGYGRGCRIRRVRVPAAREPQEGEAVGAVILSKRALAEQRARREQPQA
jgi:CheY-like chemotaxis protein